MLPPDEETWPFLSNLGNCLRMVHEESGDTRALNRAGRHSAGRTAPGQGGNRGLRPRRGQPGARAPRQGCRHRRPRETCSGPWTCTRPPSLLTATGPELARYLGNLGGALWEQYRQSGDAGEPGAGGGEHRAGRRCHPAADHRSGRAWLSNLAMIFGRPVPQRAHDIGLLTRAVGAGRAALGVPGSDVTDRGRVLSTPR